MSINNKSFSHFDAAGRARMVDVTHKNISVRTAVAGAIVELNSHTYTLVKAGEIKKGDVFAVAQVAAIMACKNTYSIIPMAHPLALEGINVSFNMLDDSFCIEIQVEVKVSAKTGVEMEALTGASVAALTIYDMCKSVQKDIVIKEIKLLSKMGGESGNYFATE